MPRDFKFVHLRMHSDCSMVNGLNDIRKIRDYNSQRHSKMTRTEIVEDIRKGAEEIIQRYGLNVTYAQKLR